MLFDSIREKFRASMDEMKERKEEEKKLETNRDVIKSEREKIVRSRGGKKPAEEIIDDEPVIKDTKINRPVENEMVEAKPKVKPEIKKDLPLEVEKNIINTETAVPEIPPIV